jgi:hypothetical protein
MNAPSSIRSTPVKRWAAWLLCGSLGWVASQAQPAGVSAPAALPPVPEAAVLKVRASLEQFQRLLAMTPEERGKALAVKPERTRNYLANELKRYDAMTGEERRTALQAERVTYYLRELVRRPANEWTNALPAIPEEDRIPVEARLRRWDQLTPELQKAVADNERTLRYTLQLEGSSQPEHAPVPPALPGAAEQSWETRIEKWRSLPPEHRQQMFNQFGKFFELSPKEQGRVLETLPAKERQETLKSLEALEKLPPDQRNACLESFDKVVGKSDSSAASFVITVQRWQAMSAEEKEVWKRLTKVLPPGLEPPPPGYIPRPAPKGATLPAPPLPGSSSK